ncbi:MAG: NACHT domain-containing protein, partial [Gammaproteobacteria bacterium]|nr:NACHT domain-containing protein [Gammaproteobacteria bacterium]
MSNFDSLLQFAEETVQRNDALIFPGSQAVQSLRTNYTDLRISDSEGKTLHVHELLGQGSRLILVGDSASGKTTALRYFAIRKSEEYISGESDVLPIYVPLRQIDFDNEKTIIESVGLDVDQIDEATLLILLDGLDELEPKSRVLAVRMIRELSAHYPNFQIILASRPAGLSPTPPDEFRFYHLESLDRAQTSEFISKLVKDESQREDFKAILASASFLQGLSHNPLLIHLLWEVYRYEARLPTVRADLYQTACDFLLSRWDEVRGIKRQNYLDIHSVHQILESLAFDAFTASQHHIPLERVELAVEKYIEYTDLNQDLVKSVIDQ